MFPGNSTLLWYLSKASMQIRPFKASIELNLYNLTMVWSSPTVCGGVIIPRAHALVTVERNDLWLGIPLVLPLINNSKALTL